MSGVRIDLKRDRKGMMWDLLLYVPTVTALFSMAAKFWYGDEINLAYLLMFLGSFFFIAGANRILKTRLMVLPSAPVSLEISKQAVGLGLRSGKRVELLKDLKYYSDYAGRTFGLAGLDGSGHRMQYIFHKGQFPSEQDFQSAKDALSSR